MVLFTSKWKIPFQIDEEDLESVSRYSWCMHNQGYPMTHIRRYSNGVYVGKTIILLHTFLLGKSVTHPRIDHKDRDKLNNTRENLRFVSHAVNARNVGITHRNTSGHRGVYRDGSGWSVSIKVDRMPVYIGYFTELTKAVSARRDAEIKYWGEHY